MEDLSSTTQHSTQTILSMGRPDTWFIDTHPPCTPPSSITQLGVSSKQAAKELIVPQDNNMMDNDDDIQVVPHPWTYPDHHQEIVGRPTSWLGGYTDEQSAFSSPVRRRTKRSATTTLLAAISPSTPSRSRPPEPIHIEGMASSPVKKSPFLLRYS